MVTKRPKARAGAVDSTKKVSALGWTALLGLLSTSAACHLLENDTRPNYPPEHPCQGKGNCEYFILLDDGGAADLPEGGTSLDTPDGGRLNMCGPCNG